MKELHVTILPHKQSIMYYWNGSARWMRIDFRIIIIIIIILLMITIIILTKDKFEKLFVIFDLINLSFTIIVHYKRFVLTLLNGRKFTSTTI